MLSEETAKGSTSTSAPRTPAASQTPPRQPEKQRSVFVPLVLGGVIAGGLGYAASEANFFDTRADVTGIEQTQIALQDRVASLEGAEPASAAAPDLSGLEASIASIADTVTELENRLADLENRPAPTAEPSGPSPEYAQELADLKASVEQQTGEIERLLANAMSVEEATANAARQAAVQGALTKITVALSTGSGYQDAVTELSDSGVSDVPAPIAETAADGVPTLQSLQNEFPDNARAALSSARAAGNDDGTTGVTGFLRRQLGARSVEPREGTDPDAVLSRAEAAVRAGRIDDALQELDTLPPEAQEAMADWLTAARTRADAEAAVQDLSQRLTAN